MQLMSSLPDPKLAVSATVFYQDLILLIQRGKEPYKNLWSLPGGHVEFGEMLQQAITREVYEECGLTLTSPSLLDFSEVITPDKNPAHHYVILVFLAHSETDQCHASGDAFDARFWTLDALSNLPLTPGTLAIIEKAFQTKNSL
jgi:ADP-ribose pyrophosphatase YjhB (NUDIX family)